jgi:hypothetical protein
MNIVGMGLTSPEQDLIVGFCNHVNKLSDAIEAECISANHKFLESFYPIETYTKG